MIKEYCEKIALPPEATDAAVSGFEIIRACGELDSFDKAKDILFEGDDKQYRSILAEVAQKSGIERYTVDMVFVIYCFERAKTLFEQKRISEDIFLATVSDLAEKVGECHQVYGIWGTSVVWWYPEFLRARRFTLGRLQFEAQPFAHDSYRDILTRGDTVYNFHVPASGPLTYDSVIDSFKKAYKFFGVEGIMPIYFSSWLIYPPHADMFPSGSNLRRFYELFDIIDEKEYADNRELWRVFSIPFTPDMDYASLPETTSLQRSFKRYLLDGKAMGGGKGIILFDGEKIIR